MIGRGDPRYYLANDLLSAAVIETKGPTLSNATFVAYFPLKGDPKAVRLTEVDQEATKLANLVARRKEAQKANTSQSASSTPDKRRFVIDDSNVGHVDPETVRARAEAEERAKSERDRRAKEGLRQFLDLMTRGVQQLKAEMACRQKYPSAGVAYELCISNAHKD